MDEERQSPQEAAEVAQWLRRHPRFLEQFPDLAITLVVPKDSGASTSLASYQLEVLRDKNRELTRRLGELFGNAQENERLAVRTHQLTLALMRATSPAETLRSLVAVLGEDFAGDVVHLTLFAPMDNVSPSDWLQVVPSDDPRSAEIFAVVGQDEPFCGRLAPDRAGLFFGGSMHAVASCALLPVPGLGIVAIGSSDPHRFFPGMGTLFLRMMAEALAVAMARPS